MGGCCPGGTYSEVDEPSPATKRRQMAEAAEKRQQDNVNRGVKVNLRGGSIRHLATGRDTGVPNEQVN